MDKAQRVLHAIRSTHSSIGQEIKTESKLKTMIEDYKKEKLKPWYLRLKERLKEITKARDTRKDKTSQVKSSQKSGSTIV